MFTKPNKLSQLEDLLRPQEPVEGIGMRIAWAGDRYVLTLLLTNHRDRVHQIAVEVLAPAGPDPTFKTAAAMWLDDLVAANGTVVRDRRDKQGWLAWQRERARRIEEGSPQALVDARGEIAEVIETARINTDSDQRRTQ